MPDNSRQARELGQGSPTWPVAGLSLALGFAVAEITGVRAIGGVVLLLGLTWCVPRWHQRGNRPSLLLFIYIVAFALSHVLGHVIGAWPAVAVVSLTVAATTHRVETRS